MSTVSIRLPEGVHRKLQEIAVREDTSLDKLVATAAAEKIDAMLSVEYLEEQARLADPDVLRRMMSRVPRVPPVPGDEILPVRGKRKGRVSGRPASARSRRTGR
jgi:hypothetical protein